MLLLLPLATLRFFWDIGHYVASRSLKDKNISHPQQPVVRLGRDKVSS
jgi:hypothetical protein